MNLFGILTETTCGEACWHAREDVCRCSCGGKNHGILCGPNGIQPKRMAKIAGCMYALEAVGLYDELYPKAVEINRQAGFKQIEEAHLVVDNRGTEHHPDQSGLIAAVNIRGRGIKCWWSQYYHEWRETDPEAPARLKFATPQQVERWAELTAWKGQQGYPSTHIHPALLWVRMKMPERPTVLMVDKETGLPLQDQLPR